MLLNITLGIILFVFMFVINKHISMWFLDIDVVHAIKFFQKWNDMEILPLTRAFKQHSFLYNDGLVVHMYTIDVSYCFYAIQLVYTNYKGNTNHGTFEESCAFFMLCSVLLRKVSINLVISTRFNSLTFTQSYGCQMASGEDLKVIDAWMTCIHRKVSKWSR